MTENSSVDGSKVAVGFRAVEVAEEAAFQLTARHL